MRLRQFLTPLFLLIAILVLHSCKSRMPGLFTGRSPHDKYTSMLQHAGLDRTAIGTQWLQAAEKSLRAPLTIEVPFRESGYFPADRVTAASYRFSVVQGQKLSIRITKKAAADFRIYADLWQIRSGKEPKLLAFADTLNNPFEFEADESETYLLRLQPELLRGGSYTVEIGTGPSLGFPVKGAGRKNIGSLFGVGRDGNTRRHEGVDIFAAFRTPAISASHGTVVRVNENNLGGRVVWMRPEGKDYTLYYAHLDKQIATPGQIVKPGDTLGLVGNTGNARTTPPHLHFGIYTSGGAVDPLPFINPTVPEVPAVRATLASLNASVRLRQAITTRVTAPSGTDSLMTLAPGTLMRAEGANGDQYRVSFPDGTLAHVPAARVLPATAALRTFKTGQTAIDVFDGPAANAAVRFRLQPGERADIKGSFKGYALIANSKNETGWIAEATAR
ncbi:M23 family metallopeptidase [Pedobacter sp. SYP-B3415]|uniref:M23 family metallopeptidase n=1 Tax=Pedobacter sp. SYP-B3415 TaxID=2496641 RepID=UPI00101B927F|nr:M23 family metallopeptidase [Pedobacter sp. SYP-B3415]